MSAEMDKSRTVEVFSAGCPVCEQAIRMVKEIACPSCDVTVLDMREPNVAERARAYGVRGGPDEPGLRAAGIGEPL